MNQELPKPLRNALARQAGDEVHPSPDVLTSFVERKLPRNEQNLVTSHLAQCADCREVVFLASSAAEDAVADKLELAAAEAPRRRWRLGLSWAVAAVAVLLVSGVLVRERFLPRPTASSVASNVQPSGSAQPAASPTPTPPETLAKTALGEISPPKASVTVANRAVARKATEQHPVSAVTALPEGESAETTAAIGGKAKFGPPAPTPQNAFMQDGTNAVSQLYAPQPLVKSLLATREVSKAQGQWRVSADGRLEHRVSADEWTRALADEATTFRVVSVVGSDVWAGGSGGALFHSDNGGGSWSRVAIATSSGSAETGAIVSIRFSDPQHGTVITGGGSRWSTSDGGATWDLQ